MSEDSSDTSGVSILDVACEYGRAGMSVFPVHFHPGASDDKAPMVGYRWPERATHRVNYIVEDFTAAIDAWGEANVSISWALGQDGYMAIDLDQPDEPEWWDAVDYAGVVNITKRGRHLIFKNPPEFEPSNSTTGFPTRDWGDVRGKGGYIVIAGPDRPGFDVTSLDQAQVFPRVDWLQPYGGGAMPVSAQAVVEFANAHATSSDKAAERNKLNGIVGATDKFMREWKGESGGRHDLCQWLLVTVAEEALAGYYSFQAGLILVRDWWKLVMADEPHRQGREFEAMCQWAVGRALAKAVSTPTDDGHQAAAPELSLIEGIKPLILPLDWSTFRARERHVEDWLVEGFWPRRRAMLCHAKAGTGKSELALYVASCMAMGCDPWTGYKTEPIRVAYFDYEMDEDQVDDRLNDLGFDDAFNLEDLADLRYFVLPPIAKLDTALGAQSFLDAIEHERCEAVIIDTFSRVISSDENEANTVQRFYEYTGQELKRRGIGQWRIDHTGKDASKGARGSSAKNEDVDFVWEMRRTDDNAGLKLVPTKQRANVDNPLILQRIDDPFVKYQRAVDISTMAPGQDVTQKVYQLEELGVDPAWGFDKTREALMVAGLEVGRKTTLQAAIRWRREASRRGAVIAKGQVEAGPGLRLVNPVDEADE